MLVPLRQFGGADTSNQALTAVQLCRFHCWSEWLILACLSSSIITLEVMTLNRASAPTRNRGSPMSPGTGTTLARDHPLNGPKIPAPELRNLLRYRPGNGKRANNHPGKKAAIVVESCSTAAPARYAQACEIARMCTLGAAWRGWQDSRAAARVKHGGRFGAASRSETDMSTAGVAFTSPSR